jgi:hypothetical protein
MLFFLLLPFTLTASPFLVILTDAKGLDYTSCSTLLETMAKHPRDGGKNGDAGHAWIYLFTDDGEIEGGHSSELGSFYPPYFEGVLHLAALGDPNPARYLWRSRRDGYFEEGSGGHLPTYAALFPLTKEQADAILIWFACYDFTTYSLVKSQCTTFVKEAAALAGIALDPYHTIAIDRYCRIGRQIVPLRGDDKYGSITLATPDALEMALKEQVAAGMGKDVTLFWQKRERPSFFQRLFNDLQTVLLFPKRLYRLSLFNH